MGQIRSLFVRAGRLVGYDPDRPTQSPKKQLGQHLVQLFDYLQVNCVLDVGANQGQYGRFLRAIGYKGNIVSFEPAGGDFDILSRVAGKDPGWFAHQLALGDIDQLTQINITSDSLFNSFLAPNDFILGQGLRIDKVENVEMKRLDSIFDDLIAPLVEPKVYLKMDTQGYDLKVVAGARESLKQVVGLQSELSVQPLYEGMPGYLENLEVLNQAGFDLTGMFPIARDNALRVIEFDCIMINRQSAGPALSVHPA